MKFSTGWMRVVFPVEDSYEGATIKFRAKRPKKYWEWTEVVFAPKDEIELDIDAGVSDFIESEYER